MFYFILSGCFFEIKLKQCKCYYFQSYLVRGTNDSPEIENKQELELKCFFFVAEIFILIQSHKKQSYFRIKQKEIYVKKK